ncbi:MAG: branched-chain amino acid ABC transporter permease [Chloroflexi bacterium]|uniref:Branched-chain amino acid ABC transporter permease n=1 Tax=Candidatus Chlorohelix allophototropha TaxID=3003348 RepID=A0A8T7M535_9CHLR|nr:branched-chain amino acid ABC transporter permease [Chloroflexota bacterium]WJW69094.1 branched-chain amino acid ABC transporter permease [Chloroflexota bacterium L227-S17]
MNKISNIIYDLLRKPYIGLPLLGIFLITLPVTITVIPMFQGNNYTYSLLSQWVILSVIAIGLNLLVGLTGMISLGHSAIFAFGGYAAAYLVVKVSLPYPIAIVFAAIVGGLIGLLLGLPALKLSGSYLAVATFGFAVAVPEFLSLNEQFNDIFNDPNDLATKLGVVKVEKQYLPIFEFTKRDDLSRYYLFLIIAAVMVFLAIGLWRSRTGRAFRAIRDSETAAQAMGVHIGRYKVLAFSLSGVFAGVAGSMYMAQIGQLDAKDLQFGAAESILFLTAIILGGLGSIPGAVIGSGLLVILPELTKSLKTQLRDITGTSIENFESLFYGLIIILCVFYMPNGIVGAFKKLSDWMRGSGQEPMNDPSKENNLPTSEEVISEARKGV